MSYSAKIASTWPHAWLAWDCTFLSQMTGVFINPQDYHINVLRWPEWPSVIVDACHPNTQKTEARKHLESSRTDWSTKQGRATEWTLVFNKHTNQIRHFKTKKMAGEKQEGRLKDFSRDREKKCRQSSSEILWCKKSEVISQQQSTDPCSFIKLLLLRKRGNVSTHKQTWWETIS